MKELMGPYIIKESEDARKRVNRAGKQGLMAAVFAGIREFFETEQISYFYQMFRKT